jgi:hypothetical protein
MAARQTALLQILLVIILHKVKLILTEKSTLCRRGVSRPDALPFSRAL